MRFIALFFPLPPRLRRCRAVGAAAGPTGAAGWPRAPRPHPAMAAPTGEAVTVKSVEARQPRKARGQRSGKAAPAGGEEEEGARAGKQGQGRRGRKRGPRAKKEAEGKAEGKAEAGPAAEQSEA